MREDIDECLVDVVVVRDVVQGQVESEEFGSENVGRCLGEYWRREVAKRSV